MGFTSIDFIFFLLPIFFVIYYIASGNWKNIILVITSFLVIGWNSPVFLPVIFSICLLNFLFGWLVFKPGIDLSVKRRIYIIAVIFNFIVFIVYLILRAGNFVVFEKEIAKPIMLSFVILSAISYISDIYYSRCKFNRNFTDYLTYMIMFPKIFMGPAVCYYKFNSQLKNRKLTIDGVFNGIELFILGFAKKCLLSDNISKMYEVVISQRATGISVVTAWLGAIALFFCMYFKLSGYVDMARGLAKMMGFYLPVNFRPPLSAKSVTKFIKRFNISIIRCLKVYIMPYFNKPGFLPTALGVCSVAFFYALFFGGTPGKFAAVFYFLMLLWAEKMFLLNLLKKLPELLKNVITAVFVLIGTVLFEHDSLYEGFSYLGNMFGIGRAFADKTSAYLLISYGITMIFCWLCASSVLKFRVFKFKRKYKMVYVILKPVCLLLLFVVSMAFCITSQGAVDLI